MGFFRSWIHGIRWVVRSDWGGGDMLERLGTCRAGRVLPIILFMVESGWDG